MRRRRGGGAFSGRWTRSRCRSRNRIRVSVWLRSTSSRERRRTRPCLRSSPSPISPRRMSYSNLSRTVADGRRYAVFPERLEVMAQSNLMKVIGRVGGELVTIEGRLRDSGWALMMPESPGEGTASPPPSTPLANMMRWVTGTSRRRRLG